MGNEQGGKVSGKVGGKVEVTGKDGKTTEKVSKLPISNSNTFTEQDFKILHASTGMSKEEIIKVFEKFVANNPDFLLDRAEFAKLYPQLRNEPVNNLDEITNFVFRAFDTDNSGFLTFNEFLAGYALTSKGDQKAKLEYAFDLYDTDKNGYLTSAELKGVISGMLDLLGAGNTGINATQLANECMKELDKSGDGKISKDEFVSGLAKNYSLRSLMSPFN